jgi:hypothetical protein
MVAVKSATGEVDYPDPYPDRTRKLVTVADFGEGTATSTRRSRPPARTG